MINTIYNIQVGGGLKLKIWESGNEALKILWYDSKNEK